jgi:PIN domain nuclease of toxin-antitoxin system
MLVPAPVQVLADPADRMIVATARHLGGVLISRDEKVIAYGAQGHVAVSAA